MLEPTVHRWIPCPDEAPADVPLYILYDAECTDGFASAYVLWKYLPYDHERIEVVPVYYDKPFPDLSSGSWVWIVNFSYAGEDIRTEPAKVIILDHHKTALTPGRYEKCSPYKEGILAQHGENTSVFVDTKRSGVGLAWDYTNNKPIPPVLAEVQDQVLRKWELEGSEEICLGLDSYPRSLVEWQKLVGQRAKLKRKGTIIKSYKDKLVKRAVDNTRLLQVLLHDGKLGIVFYKEETDSNTLRCILGSHGKDDLVNLSETSPLGALLKETLNTPLASALLQTVDQQDLSVTVTPVNLECLDH